MLKNQVDASIMQQIKSSSVGDILIFMKTHDNEFAFIKIIKEGAQEKSYKKVILKISNDDSEITDHTKAKNELQKGNMVILIIGEKQPICYTRPPEDPLYHEFSEYYKNNYHEENTQSPTIH